MKPSDFRSDEANTTRRDRSGRVAVTLLLVMPCACALGWFVAGQSHVKKFLNEDVSIGELATGKTWADKKREGKIGPFDTMLWPESKKDPIETIMPAKPTMKTMAIPVPEIRVPTPSF